MNSPGATLAEEVRTPRAAAVAGIAFSLLLITVFVLLDPGSPAVERGADWYSETANRQVRWSLTLLPFVGITFLWFIGVVRSLLGDREDRLFATVFLGSGVLFVAMLFVATALLGGVVALVDADAGVSEDLVQLAAGVNAVLMGTLAIKMAAIFTLSVSTLGRRTRLVPRWLVVWGTVTAAVLLIAPVGSWRVGILFPIWVLALSASILRAAYRTGRDASADDTASGRT